MPTPARLPAPPAAPARTSRLPAAVFVLSLVSTAWAWWVIAWPVLVGANPAKHAGHFPLMYAHALGGTAMLFFGAAALYIGWTKRQFRFHRWFGYAYLLGGGFGASLALVLALSNIHIAGAAPFAFGIDQAGDVGMSTATLAAVWLVAAAMAFRAVRNRRFEAHRGWMIRSYVLVWSFVLCRIASRVPVLAGLGGESGASLVWLSWVVPLFLCEVALQWGETGRRPAPRRPAGAPTAALLLLFAAAAAHAQPALAPHPCALPETSPAWADSAGGIRGTSTDHGRALALTDPAWDDFVREMSMSRLYAGRCARPTNGGAEVMSREVAPRTLATLMHPLAR